MSPPSVEGFCGPMTAVHNPQYLFLEIVSAPVEIDIAVNFCDGGGCGLQAAIIELGPGADCSTWDLNDVVHCDPGTSVGGVMELRLDEFSTDSIYYLLIDGCAGQICQWEITHITGVAGMELPKNVGPDTAFTEDPVICRGAEYWRAEASPPLAAGAYLWTGFPWGDEVTAGPVLETSIPANTPTGHYNICVRAISGCDTSSTEQCFDLEIIRLGNIVEPTDTLCPEEFEAGIPWGEMIITAPGQYEQTFFNQDGCRYNATKGFLAYDEPVASPMAGDTLACTGREVIFTSGASGDVVLWQWVFEGGLPQTSEEENPAVVYDSIGVFNVMLTVFNDHCSSGYTLLDAIRIAESPDATFSVSIRKDQVEFINNSGFDGTYFWDFGDGNTSTETSPTHVYSNPGHYTIQSIVTTDCGSDTSTMVIRILMFPPQERPDADPTTIFPNPNTGNFTIDLTSYSQTVRIAVLSTSGQIIQRITSTGGRMENIALGSSVMPGVYFIEIMTESAVESHRIVVM